MDWDQDQCLLIQFKARTVHASVTTGPVTNAGTALLDD